MTVAGGDVANRTIGVVAQGAAAIADMQNGSSLNLTGTGAIGAQAIDGGTINIADTAIPVFGDSDQIAYHAVGAGASINSTATTSDASALRSTLVRIEDGAEFTSTSNYTASGDEAVAVLSTGVGASVDLAGGELNVTGTNARGIVVEGGASGMIAATVDVTLTGTGGVVGLVDGQKHDLSGAAAGSPNAATTLTNLADLTLAGDDALAFIAQNSGKLVNQGEITMTGTAATAVHVLAGGVLDNQADISVSDGVGIELEGAASQVLNNATVAVNDGTAALYLHDGGGNAVGGSYVSAGSAHTILLGSGSTHLGVSGVTLTSSGSGSGIENEAEINAITLANTIINAGDGAGIRTATSFDPASTVSINVSGSGTGLAFQTAAGGDASEDLVLGAGYVIRGNGAGSIGINAQTTGVVDSAASVTMTDSDAGAAFVAGTASHSINRGSLISSSNTDPVVDLSNGTGTMFSNIGVIEAASTADIAVLGSAGGDTINLAGGSIRGVINAGDGDDSFNWLAGTLRGGFSGGAGSDQAFVMSTDFDGDELLDGGDGVEGAGGFVDTLTFTGGAFAAKGNNLTNWEQVVVEAGELSFSDGALTTGSGTGHGLIAGNGGIVNAGTAFALAGNLDIHAGGAFVGQGNGSGLYRISSNVINAGNLMLGNDAAGDRVEIAGNYVGSGGTLTLDTYLAGDGSATDFMAVAGVTSGTSNIKINNVGGPGTQTSEGIKIISVDDVAGSTGSFLLLGDYIHNGAESVVGGAYAYKLFQGGKSTPDDGAWYLRSELLIPGEPEQPLYQPGVPVYESYAQSLLGLNGLSTLQQRVGNRYWSGNGNRVISQGADTILRRGNQIESAASIRMRMPVA